ncbi:MAG: antibiotic biosynthesis monooxygenase [Anaerolineae bacterium]|jgi:quinol monooxygenase YgiN|nr:antibiotic biosynthesis monooxygenase [Anaerolineae bacterium]
MYIVQVHVTVEEDSIQAFKNATVENARNSIKEPGVARFDVIQQTDDPTRFVLIEVYKDEEAAVEHKKTEHYANWKSTVEDMMAEPRYGIKYRNIFPPDEGKW